jgi:ActR/RegA family two-component response regulator
LVTYSSGLIRLQLSKGMLMGTKILVVDDEMQVRTFLSRALDEMGGFSVEVAETAEEALQKIEGTMFDLVLVDFKLPVMDGLQLITEILKSKPQILAVLLTGHASIDSAVEAMKRGASDYLTKPVDLSELILCLSRVMEEKKRFVSIRNYPLQCSFSWEKIKEMKEHQTEFWAGDGLTRLRIIDIIEREGKIYMITQDGKKTWPLRYQKLEEIHNRIHRREIVLLAYEIDRHIPTWGNYVSGLLEFLGCDKVSM